MALPYSAMAVTVLLYSVMTFTVLVYFKNYLPEENAYVGGVTYRVRITDLPAGASFKASASHYDSVYSRIVKAVVE